MHIDSMCNYKYSSPVLENAFPLCLNLLEGEAVHQNRWTEAWQHIPDRAAVIPNRVVIRATGSCLREISISRVTDCHLSHNDLNSK